MRAWVPSRQMDQVVYYTIQQERQVYKFERAFVGTICRIFRQVSHICNTRHSFICLSNIPTQSPDFCDKLQGLKKISKELRGLKW